MTVDEIIQAAILEERERCIRAICPMCDGGLPRFSLTGREVHVDGGTRITCPANGIYALDTGIFPRIFLPKMEKK